MPTPKPGESRTDYLKRCIPMVLDDGTAKDNDQAVAICVSMFEKAGKSMSGKAISKREDVTPADRARAADEASHFADPVNKKYKLDNEDQIRAAWSYIGMPKNQEMYSAAEVAQIKKKIIAAWKQKIDPKGPPSAQTGKSRTMPLLADAMIEAAMKAGARHSKADQDHIQAAHDHLRDCGASCDAGNPDMEAQAMGKSIALKCLGMDPDDVLSYAQQETVDISEAAGALGYLASLARGEAGQEEPDDVASIADIMRKLLEFIGGEIDEMEQAASQPEGGEGKSLVFDADGTMVAFGGAVKSMPNGHIGGYLVRYSDPNSPDLTGDYFTKDTDFGVKAGAKTPVYLNHTVPLETRDGKKKVRVVKTIGEGTVDFDDVGVLIDAILFNREEYERAILGTVKSNKQSWSSGTAAHLIERQPVGRANWVKRWPLGLDASLTPTPAEPRNSAIPLKSLLTPPGRAALDRAGAGQETGGAAIPDDLLELGLLVKRKAGVL